MKNKFFLVLIKIADIDFILSKIISTNVKFIKVTNYLFNYSIRDIIQGENFCSSLNLKSSLKYSKSSIELEF